MPHKATEPATEAPGYCPAAFILATQPGEYGSCEGARDAVLLLSSVETPTESARQSLGTRACVNHGAQLYARMAPHLRRVYPNGEENGGAAIEVYNRAVRNLYRDWRMAQDRADAAVKAAWDYFEGNAA